jgi:TM2 domain-containing membrane protein YozV
MKFDIYFIITFLLCYVSGALGTHRFFNGQFKTGLLILYLTDLFPFSVPIILIELFLIVTGILKIKR